MEKKRKSLIFFCFVFLSSLPFSLVSAQGGIILTPAIIDEQVDARDILDFDLNLKNDSSSYIKLYAIVNDISVKEGKKEFLDPTQMPETTSLARWMRINRGMIKLSPGEEITIPFSIEIHPRALPGKYYAAVTFSQGSNRPKAEETAQVLNQPHLLVNIEVEEHIVEKIQVKSFQTEGGLFFSFPVKFFLELENIGNREIQPEGAIYIYNRRGEEVGSLPINQGLAGVAPLSSQLFEKEWATDKGFGKYRARLIAEYGAQGNNVQDTVYFWLLPQEFLILFAGGFMILVFILISIIFARRKKASVPEKKSPVSAIDISSAD